jgi:hypothetical protein
MLETGLFQDQVQRSEERGRGCASGFHQVPVERSGLLNLLF